MLHANNTRIHKKAFQDIKLSEHGVGHFSVMRFDANMNPMYDGFNCSQLGFDIQQTHQNFFTVFGVFFANFLGVLAGLLTLIYIHENVLIPFKKLSLTLAAKLFGKFEHSN